MVILITSLIRAGVMMCTSHYWNVATAKYFTELQQDFISLLNELLVSARSMMIINTGTYS